MLLNTGGAHSFTVCSEKNDMDKGEGLVVWMVALTVHIQSMSCIADFVLEDGCRLILLVSVTRVYGQFSFIIGICCQSAGAPTD